MINLSLVPVCGTPKSTPGALFAQRISGDLIARLEAILRWDANCIRFPVVLKSQQY